MRPNTVFKPSKRRPKAAPATPPLDHRAVQARHLDRQADAELFLGHHLAAERLAHRAAAMRERLQ